MRRLFLSASLGMILLASCSGPAPVTVTESVATPTPLPATPALVHADALRFALVGLPTTVNVWSLYDDTGTSYENYALHSDEYPRLYRLSIPARKFEPYIAEGMPSVVTQEGAFHVASVKLQTGLTWSDGSPLTAPDVAFTANTALAFHLDLDWQSAYNPDKLDHAEVVDETTVKFFFKGPFNVGDWQYGVLQGLIVSRAYWSPKLTEAASQLPSADVFVTMEKVKSEADILQARINADNVQLVTSVPNSSTAKELNARIARNQSDLNSLNSQFAKLQDEYDAALNAARAALYALADDAEPTFGPFLRVTKNVKPFTREVNPTYPFEKPNYDRAVYTPFPDDASALTSLKEDKVDVILSPNEVSTEPAYNQFSNNSALHLAYYSTSSARYLVINPSNTALADPAIRQGLSCAIDRVTLAKTLAAMPLTLFAPGGAGDWQNVETTVVCGDSYDPQKVVDILKAAGYTWGKVPGAASEPGEGLTRPDGTLFPALTLLAPSEQFDPQRAQAAHDIEVYFRYFGIPITTKLVSAEDLHYAVYSSGEYDIAILGWRLSAYPGYLCDWFQAPSPFAYNGDRLKSACDALNATADLATARQSVLEIQSILMEDLPFIPLYQVLKYDAYRNVAYPFENVLDGISGLYGAPALAIPSQ